MILEMLKVVAVTKTIKPKQNHAYDLEFLGQVLVEQDELSEAEPVYLELLNMRSVFPGPDDPATLETMLDYGNVCEALGNTAEADKAFDMHDKLMQAKMMREMRLARQSSRLRKLG